MKATKKYLFVIDTEEYSGNFEREMTAYITGVTGECGVGEGAAELYREETGDNSENYAGLLEQRADERGCHRPCAIYPTPGWFNNGLGGHFHEGQEIEAAKHYKKEATKLKLKNKKPGHYPAYMSVAIYLLRRPNQIMIDNMRERARKYAEQHKINITAFRLIKEVTSLKQEKKENND